MIIKYSKSALNSEKSLAYEFIKKLVLAWAPDFTKVTPEEAKQLEEAEQSGFVDDANIDWNNLSSMFE